MSDQVNPINPKAMLEQTFIEAYLKNKGYTLESLKALPEAKIAQLRKEACIYASCRMAEVDARAAFIHETHGVADQAPWVE
jgi:hypothetical protein